MQGIEKDLKGLQEEENYNYIWILFDQKTQDQDKWNCIREVYFRLFDADQIKNIFY